MAAHINEAQKVKKRINESLQRSLQTVSWSHVTRKYEAEWVVFKDLEVSLGHGPAENMWRRSCFSLAVKEVDGMPGPVTKAEALAAWRNQGYSWQESLQLWCTFPTSVPRRDREMNEESRKRLKSRLQDLL